MSVVEWRGGIPAVFRGTSLGTTPKRIDLGKHLERMDPEAQEGRYSWGPCKWLRIQNHDAGDALKVYFFKSHVDDDVHYITIPASTAQTPISYWEGPAEIKTIWVAAAANTILAYDVTAFMRRG